MGHLSTRGSGSGGPATCLQGSIAMKTLAVALALTFAAPAFADQAMLPSHAVSNLALQGVADNFKMVMDAVAWQATTTTSTRGGRTAILTSDSGTESAPTGTSDGLDLWNVSAVSVILKTSGNASTGTLQCYLMNAETGTWARAAAYDLTATATTHQTWTMVNIPVSVGRIYYNPVGIGSVGTVVYLVGGR